MYEWTIIDRISDDFINETYEKIIKGETSMTAAAANVKMNNGEIIKISPHTLKKGSKN